MLDLFKRSQFKIVFTLLKIDGLSIAYINYQQQKLVESKTLLIISQSVWSNIIIYLKYCFQEFKRWSGLLVVKENYFITCIMKKGIIFSFHVNSFVFRAKVTLVKCKACLRKLDYSWKRVQENFRSNFKENRFVIILVAEICLFLNSFAHVYI